MSFFTGGGSSKVKPSYTGIQLQTSSSVIPITWMWGMNRTSPNIISYTDFQSHKEKQKAGKGGGSSTTYTYSASLQLALCFGPIAGVGQSYVDQDTTADFSTLGFSLFMGQKGQAPWGYLTSKHPEMALSYSGTAYLAAANYDLGSSASTPQYGFEVKAIAYNSGILLNGDADFAICINDLLTEPEMGAGFTASLIDNSSLYSSALATTTGDSSLQTYCRAMGFSMSPVLTSQEGADSILQRWCDSYANVAIVWTGYSLKFIPYGLETVTGNGYTYVPNTEVSYVLTDDSYVISGTEPPLLMDRTDPADAKNTVTFTVNDRSNQYNSAPVTWVDQGLIDQYGVLSDTGTTGTEITDLNMGNVMVTLYGQRKAYTRNTANCTLPSCYILLEPMDIVEFDDPQLGNFSAWITSIEEQDDGTLKITADQIPSGVTNVSNNGTQSNNSTTVSTGTPPGPVNTPLILEPPLGVTGGVSQLWAVVSGGDNANANPYWGGAVVYISTDGITYNSIGEITSAGRQGKLTAALPVFNGANPDATNTLSVDLSSSGGDLQSVSSTDASTFATLSFVNGEYLSFQTATLEATNQYNLTGLYRGLYGSTPSLHATGTSFARLDSNVFKYDLPPEYVGIPLYLKFQSYNIWNKAYEDLSDCVEYSITPNGVVPTIPTGLRLSNGGSTWSGDTLPVSCDPVDGATNYEFNFYTPTGMLKRSLNSPIPSVSYTAAQAALDGPIREYHVTVEASNTYGNSGESGILDISNPPPSKVTGVTGSGGTTTGSVAYTLLTEADVDGYSIYYSDTDGFDPLTQGILIDNNGFTPQPIYSLVAGTYYVKVAAYDLWDRNPALLNVSDQSSLVISTGGGGAGGGGGGYCVTDDTLVLMANSSLSGPGETKPMSELQVGEYVWTQHEHSREWGAYPVEYVDFDYQAVYDCGDQYPLATALHKFGKEGGWVEAQEIGKAFKIARVCKATIKEAHTYVNVIPLNQGLVLSHNIKASPNE